MVAYDLCITVIANHIKVFAKQNGDRMNFYVIFLLRYAVFLRIFIRFAIY